MRFDSSHRTAYRVGVPDSVSAISSSDSSQRPSSKSALDAFEASCPPKRASAPSRATRARVSVASSSASA